MSGPEQLLELATAWSAQDWALVIGALGTAAAAVVQHFGKRAAQKKVDAFAEATAELEEEDPKVAGRFKRKTIDKATRMGVKADWLKTEVERAKTRRFDRDNLKGRL